MGVATDIVAMHSAIRRVGGPASNAIRFGRTARRLALAEVRSGVSAGDRDARRAAMFLFYAMPGRRDRFVAKRRRLHRLYSNRG